VVAAAVILVPGTTIADIDDSKRLSAAARVRLDATIRGQAQALAIGMCTAEEIDRHNIFAATREAARRAVAKLTLRPEHILVDAYRVPRTATPQTALVHGDRLSQSIAAASIVAKVARDKMMQALHAAYPGYGFAQHVGYGTAAHLAALAELGPCPAHRHSFGPVARAVRPPALGRLGAVHGDDAADGTGGSA
jgi:ribonuclease HII